MSDDENNMDNMDGDQDENQQNIDEAGNEEEKLKDPINPLKPELLKKSLLRISKTYSNNYNKEKNLYKIMPFFKFFYCKYLDGLSYAFTYLSIVEKELDDIGEEIGNYNHLRDINISNNKFRHIKPLENINYLVKLDCSKNEIRELEIFGSTEKLQFLQILNMSNNKIKELPELNLGSLIELNLETNLIETAREFKGLPKLKKLNLKQNKLKDCAGLHNCPELDVLFLVGIYIHKY